LTTTARRQKAVVHDPGGEFDEPGGRGDEGEKR
jgi:hypothetical protein